MSEDAGEEQRGQVRFLRADANKSFLLLHVAGHPDVTAQALRLGNVLKEAGVSVTVFGAKETTHNKLNADLGLADDPATKALSAFLDKALKK